MPQSLTGPSYRELKLGPQRQTFRGMEGTGAGAHAPEGREEGGGLDKLHVSGIKGRPPGAPKVEFELNPFPTGLRLPQIRKICIFSHLYTDTLGVCTDSWFPSALVFIPSIYAVCATTAPCILTPDPLCVLFVTILTKDVMQSFWHRVFYFLFKQRLWTNNPVVLLFVCFMLFCHHAAWKQEKKVSKTGSLQRFTTGIMN